ncbi:MAG: PAS domain S-box protein [Nitrospiraceae bacterium]|jgi:PAS domain S-box-containing protein|uniref:PAS domain S-box protein n=1 Tax=Nitrospira cf. moscoviensis SBR1015 TaxID=96242 RepID=UPI000A0C780F|nr:PAS domain S-box protein [Nitrospira cf. moscoviensis SBR1015]MBY0249486.1 PAS domain S-box protein [Nitrospiraceae bacterium]OQW33345.1 MAG: hypothetical protein A4E20_12795 [Nitrospira sp. SG-bin2]
MTTPTTLPEALTEIEGLRGQVRELLRLLGQEAPLNTGAAGLSTSEIAGLNGMPEISLAQVSLERKQTGRERTQIVAEGRNVIEIAPDIIFKLDLHGNLAGWNKRLETVTGFVPEELNSRPAVSFAPECEREQTAAAIRQAFEQGYAELEGHLLTKTGRMIPYHWTGATLENHLGHAIGLIGVGRDRTVVKHAEEALRTSEARFRELVETTTDWMWEINELGAYTYCSPKIREFLGYEPDEAIGKTPFDFMPPEEAHRVAALFGPIAAARKPFAGIENINRRKDGQLVTFECRGIPIFGADGSFRGYRGFDQDVTRRKLFELQNRERLDSMIRFQEIQLHLHRQPFQDLTEGLRTILRMAANALSIERVGIWLFSDDHSSLICRELYQLSLNKYESGAVLDASRYPRYFDALDQSLPLAVNDVLTDPRTSEFIEDYFIPLGISSVMDMAVRRDGTIIGVVWFEHIGLKTEWSEEEQAFARSIGDHVALCLLDAERQQTEMTLRESEERFAAAVEGATDVLWDAQRIPGVPWHAPETPIWWSPRVRQLLGLEDGESFDTLGQWVARLHPEDMDRVLSQLTAHIEHRVSYDVEYRLRTNHGEYRWMRGKGQAIWDKQGEPRRMSGSCQDISERKRAESALQESESHFRAMIENSSDIITVLDLDGTIRFESPSFERLLGYAQHEIDGRIAFDFIHPDDLPAVIEKFQRIVQQPGETQTAEFRFRHQDGSWLSLEGVGRATCDARSRSCVIVNSRDITERKRAERSLLQTRDLLTSFVENVPAAVAMLDRELRYVAVSRRWLTDYRLGDEPLVGRRHYDVFPEIQDMKEWQEIHQRCLSGSVERREEDRFVRADGSEDWLCWEVRPWHDITGEIGGIIMFTEVVTERKRAEAALRASEERFAAAVEGSTDVLWDAHRIPGTPWHEPNTPIWWSPRVRQLLSLEDREPFDTLGQWVARLHPDDMNHVLGRLAAHIEERIPYDVEYRIRTNRGEYRWIRGRGQAIWDELGEPRRMSGSCQDITDRKQAEEALRASEERFATAFNEAAIGMALVAPDGCWLEVNQALCWILGYSKEEFQSKAFQTLTHPDDLQQSLLLQQRLLSGELKTHQIEKRYLHKAGHAVWTILNVSSVRNDEGQVLYHIAQIQDITERKRAEQVLEAERQVLALMAAARPLTDTLAFLCECCESIGHDMLVSVLLLDQDGQHLRHGAGPSLPGAYNTAIDGVAIGPGGGSCGTAAYLGRQVIVADIATDPLWEKYRALALSHGLRACWSTPILSEDRRVLGTFAIYYRMPHEPLQVDWYLIDRMTHLACLAIERKQAEHALKSSEEKLRQALLASNTGLWDWNTETGEVFFSKEWKSQLGFSETELPDTLESWESRLHPDDRAHAVAYARQYLDNPAGAFRQDFRLLHKDGTYRWIDSHASLVTEPDGRRVRLLGSHTDITARKQAEEANRRLSAIVESTNDAIISEDLECRVTSWNRGAEQLFGYQAAEVIGRSITILFPPDRLQEEVLILKRLKRGESIEHFETIRLAKDGRRLNISLTLSPMRDEHGTIVGISKIAHDVTERKRMEDALRMTQFSIDRASDAVLWMDSGSHILNVNDAACHMLNYTREGLLAMSLQDLDPNISTESWALHWAQLKQKGSMTFESKYWSSTGRVVETEITANYLQYGGKEYDCAVVRDIRERKRVEAELRASEERYRTLYDETPTMYFTLATDGTVRSVNRFGAEQLGYVVEELVGHSVLNVFYEEDKAIVAASLSECLKVPEITHHWEFRKVRKDRSLIWVRETVRVGQSSNGETVVLVACEDITERKQVEVELQNSHAFMRQVIDTDPNFIFAKDRDGRFTLVNKAIADVYGTTVDGLIGKTDADFNLSQEEVTQFRLKDLEVMDTLEERFLPEETITDATGKIRWLQTIKRPLLDAQGHAVMLLGSSTDITARKHVEEMLRQREWDLRAAVEERERISEDLHDGILQSIFAVGLGLESCRTLVSKLPRKKAATPLMAGLNRAIGQLNHVMTEVRNFIAGIESHVLEEADIGETLRTMVQAMCASNGTACRVKIEEAAVRELSTEQAYHAMNVIREALSNSLRHSEAGRITLSFKRLRRSVRLSVTDNGKGFIPDSVRDVGHGLANMAARARKLGGRMEVRSQRRKGTKVLLDMPRRLADA